MTNADVVVLVGNIAISLAYLILTAQIAWLITRREFSALFGMQHGRTVSTQEPLFFLVMFVAVLFSTFIGLCGLTHFIAALMFFLPSSYGLTVLKSTVMVLCAFVSVLTAAAGFKLFPIVLRMLSSFELGRDGRLQHSENYLVEAVEMIHESIVILNERMIALRGNEATKRFFGDNFIGTKITDLILEEDKAVFNETVMRVMGSYNFTPATVELRLARNIDNSYSPSAPAACSSRSMKKMYKEKRVHCESNDRSNESERESESSEDSAYCWVEATLCKGVCMTSSDDFEYDVKMIVRSIDDRKRHASAQKLVERADEQSRINESKLRYVSCIAHDLKTPLQSFAFTVDLLRQTSLSPEQEDLLQQADVAVDLMKLTISQTMDISKALTGAKLMARRSTVFLSRILDRVRVIM